jgi:hypothetical protein
MQSLLAEDCGQALLGRCWRRSGRFRGQESPGRYRLRPTGAAAGPDAVASDRAAPPCGMVFTMWVEHRVWIPRRDAARRGRTDIYFSHARELLLPSRQSRRGHLRPG